MILRVRLSAMLAVGAMLVAACGAADSETEQASPSQVPTMESFDQLKVADGFVVQVGRGNTSQVELSVSGVPADQVVAQVSLGALELRTTGSVPAGADLAARVEMPSLSQVTATAGAEVTLVSGMTLGGGDVGIDLTVAATFDGEVSARTIAVQMQAGSKAILSGSAHEVVIVGSEAGVLSGFGLTVADAKVDLSSGTNAELSVQDVLRVKLASAAQFKYQGKPQIAKSDLAPGTSLQHVNP